MDFVCSWTSWNHKQVENYVWNKFWRSVEERFGYFKNKTRWTGHSEYYFNYTVHDKPFQWQFESWKYCKPNIRGCRFCRNSSCFVECIRCWWESSQYFLLRKITSHWKKDFFSPLKQIKLKTFSENGKKTCTKVQSETVALQANWQLLRRILVCGMNTKIEDLAKYSLSPIPNALANCDGCDGTFRKTNKSTLMHIWWICKKIRQTLFEMARKTNSRRVDFVCDRYFDVSIKNMERKRRIVGKTQSIKISWPDQKRPSQFQNFLASGKNKEALIEFLFVSWSSTKCFYDIELVTTHGNMCHKISYQSCTQSVLVEEIPELFSDHEEADSRLLLHCQHIANSGYNSIAIRSPDTRCFSSGCRTPWFSQRDK